MEKRAVDTAHAIQFFYQLFDSLNGSSFKGANKVLRSAVTKGSQHISFWQKAIDKLKNFHFVKNRSFFDPPSLKNLIRTIKNFIYLNNVVKNIGFDYLMPRSFNQDGLENFFGKMRLKGFRNINPTSTNFTAYYKGLLVNQITSKQSVGANCEDDNSEVFITLQRLVTQVCVIIFLKYLFYYRYFKPSSTNFK